MTTEDQLNEFNKEINPWDMLTRYNEISGATAYDHGQSVATGYAASGIGFIVDHEHDKQIENMCSIWAQHIVLAFCTPIVLIIGFAVGLGPILGLAYMPFLLLLFFVRMHRHDKQVADKVRWGRGAPTAVLSSDTLP